MTGQCDPPQLDRLYYPGGVEAPRCFPLSLENCLSKCTSVISDQTLDDIRKALPEWVEEFITAGRLSDASLMEEAEKKKKERESAGEEKRVNNHKVNEDALV